MCENIEEYRASYTRLLKRPDGRCRRLGLSRNAELSFGTIENVFAASDLPPEGPKKKSWADLMHLAHFADLADLARLEFRKGELLQCRGRHADFVHFVDFLYVVHFAHLADFADFTDFGSET